jgi:hypothetical protein
MHVTFRVNIMFSTDSPSFTISCHPASFDGRFSSTSPYFRSTFTLSNITFWGVAGEEFQSSTLKRVDLLALVVNLFHENLRLAKGSRIQYLLADFLTRSFSNPSF